MWRTLLAVIGGFVAWLVIATVLDIGLRLALPGYTQAEPILAFTLPMELARLTIGVLAALAAGAAARAIAPASRIAPWIAGLLLLALFLPVHIHIGARLPLWYHVGFLLPLVPLVALGAQLFPPLRRGQRRASSPV